MSASRSTAQTDNIQVDKLDISQVLEDIAETPYPTRSKDLSFYLVLFFAVLPIWTIVPLSWTFVIYALRSGQIWSFAWKGRLSFAVALCEVRSTRKILKSQLCNLNVHPP